MAQNKIVAVPNRGWKTKLPDAHSALLPPSTARPNPVLAENRVFAAVFAPGAVCSADQRTGELLWRTSLGAYVGSAVVPANGLVFAASSVSVYALAQATGEIRWEFTPNPEPGEWVYSQPVVGRGRVFIGDRCGDFHCLDASTGKPLWRRRISRTGNNDVNATALIAGATVITANNAGVVCCCDIENGKTIWRQTIDGPCGLELLRAGSKVIVGAISLYALDLQTGVVRYRLGFPSKAVGSITVAGKRVVATLDPNWEDRGTADWGDERTWNLELLIIENGREVVRRPLKWSGALRTCTETGLIYCVDVSSAYAIDSATGLVVHSWRKHIGLPDARNGFLYGLTDKGVLFAAPMVRGKTPQRSS
jgi:outer membrane protein assembly factor BamB